ncbi:GSCFA domain-containing protein [Marilutibacter chinensis]|uniref:GSCFA domain-containing protein n=1 Tax=Marilutibacter chinensis TaxID=2912247 RepID=A0ABS9HYF9_9GAMM|nr:GSCFA domain-containing protein [Lysobacter chinensis]MCF7223778.1 GSCFA domain-containing protein [Lysobacter chinensis]
MKREKDMYWRTLLAQVGNKWRHDDNPLESFSDAAKFLRRDTRAYSIGSCFALNINRWLKFQGFAVPEVTWGIHYNSRTILYELQRAAGHSAPDVEWCIPRREGGVVYADALRHCIDAPDVERLAAIKAQIASESRREFMRADAFIVTLGLSDIWEVEIDDQLITLNRSPYLGATLLNGVRSGAAINRFLSVTECVEDLRKIVQIVRATKPAQAPIVFTISPVPLKHTGGNVHPHVANSRSKATLLAAIHAFLDECHEDPHVYYFPAYEFFQMHGLGIPLWQGDGRHPTTEAVAHVAESFVKHYSTESISVRPGFSVPQFA